MSDDSEGDVVDPLTTGAVKAAASVGAEAGGLMARALGPTADVIGEWLKDKVEFRLTNTRRILEAAERKADTGTEGQVPPRVAYQILDEGSMCDDELMAEYLGGVLAGSRTPDGRDDRGVAWARFINGMSAIEVRAHFVLYRAWDELLSARPDLDLWGGKDRVRARLYVEQLEFGRGLDPDSGYAGGSATGHALVGLERRGLIGAAAWGPSDHVVFKEHPFGSVVTAVPTLAGLELYGWALGMAGLDPNHFHAVPRPSLDPSLPRLRQIHMAERPTDETPPGATPPGTSTS